MNIVQRSEHLTSKGYVAKAPRWCGRRSFSW